VIVTKRMDIIILEKKNVHHVITNVKLAHHNINVLSVLETEEILLQVVHAHQVLIMLKIIQFVNLVAIHVKNVLTNSFVQNVTF